MMKLREMYVVAAKTCIFFLGETNMFTFSGLKSIFLLELEIQILRLSADMHSHK